MWFYDIGFNAYSRDMSRQIFVVRRNKDEIRNYASFNNARFPKRRWEKYVYTVVEEWHTPESQGDTGDWDYYTFMTYPEASFFIAKLIMKLNSPQQRALMHVAEEFVTDITKEHKKVVKQMETEQKQKDVKKIRRNAKR
jgi:hypothetical protein